MAMMYCPRDNRNVEAAQGYNLVLLIVLLIVTFVIGGLIYFFLTYRDKCPFCGSHELMAPLATGPLMIAPGMMVAMPGQPYMPQPMMQQPMPPPAATQNCPGCGKTIVWYPEHNRWWCAAENKWL
jgi:ribosomal protein S27AE